MPWAKKLLQILQGDRLPLQCSTPTLILLKDSAEHLRAVDFRCDQVQATATWRSKLAKLSRSFQAWITVAATLEQDEA